MGDSWQDLQLRVQAGDHVRYWSKTQGYSYGVFIITGIDEKRLTFTIPRGDGLTVTRRDYEQTVNRFDDYLSGLLNSADILQKSGRSAYIFSIAHMLRTQQPKTTFADLLVSTSRVYLKSEFAPISDGWPAVSFTNEAPAHTFADEFDPSKDVVIFAGTQTKDTPAAYKAKLLSAARLSGEVVDSRLVIPHDSFALYQAPDVSRFTWSIPAVEAWAFADFPSAQALVGDKYKVLGLGRARQLGIELSSTEVDRIRSLPVRTIPISVPNIEDLKEQGADVSLIGQFARVLAGLRSRAQRGGSMVTRIAPLRICALSVDDMKNLWMSQQGFCKLCAGPIPEGQKNFLLQVSADRIDSSNPNYDLGNTQLTHLACNLAKNAATEAELKAWLTVVRGA